MLDRRSWLVIEVWLAFFGGVLGAAEPVVDALVPTGAQLGTEVRVKVIGKVEPWPCQAWCEESGVAFIPDKEKPGEFLVKVGKRVRPGPYLVRFFNDEGAAAPRIFVVGAEREIAEVAEDHGSLTKPQQLQGEPPFVVNGRLEKGGQADFYSLELKRGQRVGIWMEGYSLFSPIDPHLHVFAPDGVKLAMGNDRAGGLDPELDFEASVEGVYTVGVMAFAHPPSASVDFSGSAKAVYRLHFGEPGGRLERPVFNGEKEGKWSIPLECVRAISGEEERFEFDAKKGENLLLRVEGEGIGSRIDGVLRLEDSEGKTIKEIDDTKPTSEPELAWWVPGDGTYSAVVGDRFRRKGEDVFFKLTVTEQGPDFSVKADRVNYAAKPGEGAEIGLSVERKYGHVGPLKVRVSGLPGGVDVEKPDLGEKATSGVLKLKVNSRAKPASSEFRVEVEDGVGLVRVAYFSFQDASSRGPFLIDSTESLWMTVRKSE